MASLHARYDERTGLMEVQADEHVSIPAIMGLVDRSDAEPWLKALVQEQLGRAWAHTTYGDRLP